LKIDSPESFEESDTDSDSMDIPDNFIPYKESVQSEEKDILVRFFSI
jgi:hypothetical protein